MVKSNLAHKIPHFVERCYESGITKTDPYVLQSELRDAVRSLGAVTPSIDFVERVVPSYNHEDCTIYRFRIVEGIFYAPCGKDGWPRTILTKEMVRKKKWAYKMTRRGFKHKGKL